jgi:hypothetical protein
MMVRSKFTKKSDTMRDQRKSVNALFLLRSMMRMRNKAVEIFSKHALIVEKGVVNHIIFAALVISGRLRKTAWRPVS